MWSHRHLLGIDGLSRGDVLSVLDRAGEYFADTRAPGHRGTLRGKTVLNLFYESSTRTRTSFELAAKRLGGDVVNVNAATSSASKGETLLDTVKNLEAMASDLLVLR